MFKKNDKPIAEGEVINIEAGIEGNVKFSGPVNLRLNGKFEGELETKGTLIIGEKADVKVKTLKGDTITIAGRVKGDIISSKRLELAATARVIGNIEAPILVIQEGAILKGDCQMPVEDEKGERKESTKKKEE
ncbi:MAG: polymer-forming cytoskeletal protein [Candidatus Omnitrophota bacterium]|nr:polymer-forming cytoskeletal protein [Candidatus Omnitrophota bacterium]